MMFLPIEDVQPNDLIRIPANTMVASKIDKVVKVEQVKDYGLQHRNGPSKLLFVLGDRCRNYGTKDEWYGRRQCNTVYRGAVVEVLRRNVEYR